MSGDKPTPTILWDTSVFLAWFNREEDKDLSLIATAVREIMANSVVLFVSAITRVEVLNTAKSPNAREKFKRFCKRRKIVRALPDERVVDLATEIRQAALDEHNASPNTRRKLKTPDSLIAATALIYKVPTMFSFDPGLLSYSEHDVLRGLKVIPPESLLPPPPPAKAKNKELFGDPEKEDVPPVAVATEAGAGALRSDEHTTTEDDEQIAEEDREEDEGESVIGDLPYFAGRGIDWESPEEGDSVETPPAIAASSGTDEADSLLGDSPSADPQKPPSPELDW